MEGKDFRHKWDDVLCWKIGITDVQRLEGNENHKHSRVHIAWDNREGIGIDLSLPGFLM